MNKKTTNRKRLRGSSVFFVLICLVLGGGISLICLNKHIKPEPDLPVQVEMRNAAMSAAFDGLLSLNDDRYTIIDYSPDTVTVRGETHDCVVSFSEGKMQKSEFFSNITIFEKMATVFLGSLIGMIIGTLVGTIIKKKKKNRK